MKLSPQASAILFNNTTNHLIQNPKGMDSDNIIFQLNLHFTETLKILTTSNRYRNDIVTISNRHRNDYDVESTSSRHRNEVEPTSITMSNRSRFDLVTISYRH